MIVLAADTSTSINTVAVCDGERLLAEIVAESARSHTERLLLTVQWVLEQARLCLKDVDMLAVSCGPGSFTGLRVGMAAWKGLAAANGLGLVSVPTLDAMARNVPLVDGVVCPMLDARMNEVFWAVYRFSGGHRTKTAPDRVDGIERVFACVRGGAVFLGDGAERYRRAIMNTNPEAVFAPLACSIPRASLVAAEAVALLDQGVSTDPAQAEPVYLRKSQAEQAREAAET